MRRFKSWQGGIVINKRIVQLVMVVKDTLFDKKVILGIGIGIMIATITLMLSSYNKEVSKSNIEKKAREYGMHYDNECKVIFSEDVK